MMSYRRRINIKIVKNVYTLSVTFFALLQRSKRAIEKNDQIMTNAIMVNGFEK